jgi:hypothetical protein
VAQKHRPNISNLRAERHADADLTRALCGDVRHHAIESDDAEKTRALGIPKI